MIARPLRVPGVDVRDGDPEHPGPGAANHQGRALGAGTARPELTVAGLVVATGDVDVTLAEQGADDREGLLEAGDPVVTAVAEGAVLGLVPASADTGCKQSEGIPGPPCTSKTGRVSGPARSPTRRSQVREPRNG